jgi:hypothetical protein
VCQVSQEERKVAIEHVGAEIGQWYLDTRSGERIRVVGLDDRSQMIEIQSFAGDVGEVDPQTWNLLPLVRCPEPEDGSGAMDDVEADDWNGLAGRGLSRPDVLALLSNV